MNFGSNIFTRTGLDMLVIDTSGYRKIPMKSPPRGGGGYLSGPKRGGLIREGWLNREGGGGISNHIFFDEISNNFPNLSSTPINKTEQEIVFVSPFYKCNVIYTLTQHYFWK